MEVIAYIVVGLVIGLVVGWLVFKLQLGGKVASAVAEKERAYNDLNNEFAGYKSAAEQKEKTHGEQLQAKDKELEGLRNDLKEVEGRYSKLETDAAEFKAKRDSYKEQFDVAKSDVSDLRTKLEEETKALNKAKQELSTAIADLKAANDKLATQKTAIEDLQKTMQEKFENIANKILEEKSAKFTEANEKNIKALIDPLGKDIEAFKEKVTQESKERFSLGEKVKELVALNNATNEAAINLTKALKGEAKTQGLWGEMILESILELSGLRPQEQYFMEHQLFDEHGKALRSEVEGKKMRPDALIMYPDDRHVIVDSKVSLTAYARAVATTEDGERDAALSAHVASLKSHIEGLSAKGYEDYSKSLDFVLMFVPSEAAYSAALQKDPNLWAYAYSKRILLQSPTNLITSLKLIEELWKREARNQNAEAIAQLGAKLYDKLVGFVSSLEAVGEQLEKAKGKYDQAYGQLKTGRGNLIGKAAVLKSKVVDTKKELPEGLVTEALLEEEMSNDEENDG
ncbi:MAG: DNA recombination protein RmuC [Flavobacteriales bacterium]|nr:DNA recombination protein RmuC [Flavobacteriales bacterium]